VKDGAPGRTRTFDPRLRRNARMTPTSIHRGEWARFANDIERDTEDRGPGIHSKGCPEDQGPLLIFTSHMRIR
jgi:hypothetical protein